MWGSQEKILGHKVHHLPHDFPAKEEKEKMVISRERKSSSSVKFFSERNKKQCSLVFLSLIKLIFILTLQP